MTIIIRRPWTRQPQRPVALDLSSDLAQGLVGSWTPVDPGRVFGRPAYIVGNVSISAGARGRSWRGGLQESYNYVRVDRTAAYAYTDQVTFEALISVASFQTSNFPFISGVISQYQGNAAGDAGYPGPVLRFNATANLNDAYKPVFSIVQSGVEKSAQGADVSTGVHHLLGTYDGANVTLYVDGAQVAQTAASGAFDNSANNWISLLSDYTGWASDTHKRCLNGELFLARIYNKGKTPAQAKRLAENAWQLFYPRRIIIPTTAVAASAPTLSALSAINVTASSAQPRITYTF